MNKMMKDAAKSKREKICYGKTQRTSVSVTLVNNPTRTKLFKPNLPTGRNNTLFHLSMVRLRNGLNRRPWTNSDPHSSSCWCSALPSLALLALQKQPDRFCEINAALNCWYMFSVSSSCHAELSQDKFRNCNLCRWKSRLCLMRHCRLNFLRIVWHFGNLCQK